jgi:hypothetical protein
MIKTFATALLLASTLAFGITDAQARTAPKAYAAVIGVKHECKVEHGKRTRCHIVKHAVKHSINQRTVMHSTTALATINTPVSPRRPRATTALAIAASASPRHR